MTVPQLFLVILDNFTKKKSLDEWSTRLRGFVMPKNKRCQKNALEN